LIGYYSGLQSVDLISLHAEIEAGLLVFPDDDPMVSNFLTNSMFSKTLPNTTCFPSNHEVLAVVRKN